MCDRGAWLFVALKGKHLEPRPLEVVELGAEACVLQARTAKLGAKSWEVTASASAVTVAAEKKALTFQLPGGCWAKAVVSDLDRDGVPDLIAQRGDGSVAVWLSRGAKSPVPPVATAAETGG